MLTLYKPGIMGLESNFHHSVETGLSWIFYMLQSGSIVFFFYAWMYMDSVGCKQIQQNKVSIYNVH